MTEQIAFLTGTGVPLPKPKVFPTGPRGSKYPLETTPVGGFFALLVADAAKAQQKRSYLSALGKSRSIKVSTRYFPEGWGDKAAKGTPFEHNPTVVCWNMGPRTEIDAGSEEE